MIGKLKGLVDGTGEDFVILDVGGVGYLVHCSARTLAALPSSGEAVALAIETHVREDMIRLYGFRQESEREWFRLLQSVQGVGAKVALAILSVLEPDGLAGAIATGDRAAVARAPGVGPKLAARIVAEMKGKGPAFDAGTFAPTAAPGADGTDAVPSAAADTLAALVRLGYQQARAAVAVATAIRSAGAGAEVPALIRLALRDLAQG